MATAIPPEYAQFVQGAIASGLFQSESEVIGEGLRLLQQREKLRADVHARLSQLDRGQCIELDDGIEVARVVHGARDVSKLF
jgi:putative addiction module CopG family antidote